MEVKKIKDTNEEYHASEAVSRSKLFRMIKNGQVCPQNYHYLEENPPEQTGALLFGRAFHKAVLEPETFADEFVVAPICDRRTKEGKTTWERFVSEAENKDVLTAEEYEHILGMVESINRHPIARKLLRGEIETSYYWMDELTGIQCRCRPDARRTIGGVPHIIDLKSTQDASTEHFSKDAIKFGYDLQTAMYKKGVDAFYGAEHRFIFIPVEKTPPYTVNVMLVDDLFIKKGNALFRELLGELKYCMETGDWYGYSGPKELGGINDLTLPAYLLKEFE